MRRGMTQRARQRGGGRQRACFLLLSTAAAALGADTTCQRFVQYNSQREGNSNLEDEFRSIENPADCSSQCSVTESCHCFSYNQENQRCFLMRSCETPTPRHNFISGVAGCTVPDPTPELCRVTPRTATPGASVLRMKWQYGAGRILHKAADCAGGGALYKVEWRGGVRNDYRVGCRHAVTELFHANCATEELLAQWENQIQEETESHDAQLVVYLPEVPELTGVYRPDGTYRQAPIWRSTDCNDGQGCVLFNSGGGFWMVSHSADGHTRNVGQAKSAAQHNGSPPQEQAKWDVLVGTTWQESAGAVDTEEGMSLRNIDWRQAQGEGLVAYLPELPSLTGTYRKSGTWRGHQFYRSEDCATGACVLFYSGGGFWMISGRLGGHERNAGMAKTTQPAGEAPPDDAGLKWEVHTRQGWGPSVGRVVQSSAMRDLGWSMQDAAVTVALGDTADVDGTYHIEGRHNGLPLFRSDDCPSHHCSMYCGGDGHWVISESAEPNKDQGQARAKNRVPHWRVAGSDPLNPEPGPGFEWEGQSEFEPQAVRQWEYLDNSGDWKPSMRAVVTTLYAARQSAAGAQLR